MHVAVVLIALFVTGATAHAQEHRFVSGSRNILGTESNRSASVRAGDLDGDGDLDLVVANGRHWPQQNFAFLNQSRGRFNLARRLGEDLSTSYACELGDLNEDGKLDLVVGNDTAPSRVMLGSGTGSFSQKGTLGSPTSVRSVTIADVDGDGHLDVLMTCRGRPNPVFFGDGTGKFPVSETYGSQDDSTIAVAVADVNRDSLPDLILANRDSQPNVLLLGIGNRKFASPDNFGNPNDSSRDVVVGDFNSDGRADWAIANIGAANSLFLGDGEGGVLQTIAFGPDAGQTYALAIGDMNQDGQLDIVACNAGQQNAVYFSRPRKLGTSTLEFQRLGFGAEDGLTYGCCVGDFDGDGDQDIAVANSDSRNQVFINVRK